MVNPSVGLESLAIIINDVDLPVPIASDVPTQITILRWESYCPLMRLTITLPLNATTLVLGQVGTSGHGIF
ncbi:hypothetical protein COJ48_25655 [Bacillus cereus]|nr:hypothetical protein CON06_26320 [Bacillus cereus]PFA03137.1 hypothetical protein CN382_29490 [Bacillus cereus]PFM34520.1 hypothetical protein COJ43_24520 [Bacillus cereus]PFM59292.1 hypothetical protein COJ48_25655 [Bacillus cereus]PGP78761.1 hypothetical protein CN997_19890 [Bacillus cereus]